MIQFKLTELALDLGRTYNINFAPKRADAGSSGYDLKACIEEESLTIWPDEVYKIPTGVHIWIGGMENIVDLSENIQFAGLYLPRSSNPGLVLTNTVGLLDSSYQGESFLRYRNISDEVITIERGDRIGQLVIFPTYIGSICEVNGFVHDTSRGEGGFGSSGR
jgi:dUTP pyrophosphatase